ncbi:MAG TPA: penicillin-binding protein 2 [Gemmatimonadaceae bacterium]|nr:penicillin-binding protein 2 [Gemmatimonadaceae bacterium]
MKTPSRVGIVHLALAVFACALLFRAASVQLVQKQRWTASAQHQQSLESTIPAPRGDILDALGETMAQSRDMVKLEVAPQDVRDRRALRNALIRAGVHPDWAVRATDTSRKWVEIPGRFVALSVAGISAMRGVHTTSMIDRSYGVSEGTRRIVGRVDQDGNAVDGVELALDTLLRGVPGAVTTMRDGRGRRFESPTAPKRAPVQGNTVVLTINHELQEIAERALGDAVARMNAEGGDVVVMDPTDGEVLAMASKRRDPRATASTALTEPYEPGSTLKPFIAAMLLEKKRARETDVVNTFGGQMTINGRTITDEHQAASFTLADVIRYSSNVGIVQFATRLSAREEFEALRDFGFGTPTGVPYPVEAAGTLREPKRWSKQSANSLAMGYEIAVTPLQLVAAYVAIANDGELLEPALVKEVRAPDGQVLYRHERRVVRRVLSADVARRMRHMLLGVVDAGGTAKKAELETFTLAGKTGTARRTVNGRYAASQHIPTFVGLFPGDKPQFVILVKLDNPQGEYFGGLTAAPVTKAVLEAALASRNASLDRRTLAQSRQDKPLDTSTAAARAAAATKAAADSAAAAPARQGARALAAERAAADSAGLTPFVATLPAPRSARAVPVPPRPVPDVRGLSLRQAVHALHTAGFRVQLASGPLGSTSPAAGSLAPIGTVVQLTGTP